jgi:hypothetical protein
MPKLWTSIAILSAAAALTVQPSRAEMKPAPLSLDQVVDNLIHMNAQRAEALRSFEATRKYHLVYRGFPSDKEAEMTVDATYESPSTKNFKVVSQHGSKVLLDRVFKQLLESEKEAAQPEIRNRTQLNRANYEFVLLGYESSDRGGQYILQVTPKTKNKFVYRGKIWVDGVDFAVTRIEAEPAQNPSFWTKKSEIRHEYVKIDGFWLPARNESISYIRLGGRATLTIEYNNYKLTDARDPTAAVSAATLSQGAAGSCDSR